MFSSAPNHDNLSHFSMIPSNMNPIILNNKALRCLEDGDFQSADELFCEALKLLISPDIEKTKRSKSRFAWSKEASIPISEADETIGTFIYSRGMYMKRCGGELKAVILYNAGLAAHLLGTRRSDSRLLRKAHSMYTLSRMTLKKRHADGFRSPLCHKHYFHMALLNNLGQLSLELVDYQSSKVCFAQLYKNLMCLMTRKKAAVYGKRDLEGMIANSIVEMPNTAPCA